MQARAQASLQPTTVVCSLNPLSNLWLLSHVVQINLPRRRLQIPEMNFELRIWGWGLGQSSLLNIVSSVASAVAMGIMIPPWEQFLFICIFEDPFQESQRACSDLKDIQGVFRNEVKHFRFVKIRDQKEFLMRAQSRNDPQWNYQAWHHVASRRCPWSQVSFIILYNGFPPNNSMRRLYFS